MKRFALSLLALLLATLLLSCGNENRDTPAAAPAQSLASQQQTAPTDTPEPSEAATAMAALILTRVHVTGTAQATPIPEPIQPAGPVANANANLRGGPGTNYEILGAAQPGQVLDVVARNEAGDWYQLDSGAWIAAFLVANAPPGLSISEPSAPPTQPPAPTPAPAPVAVADRQAAQVVNVVDGDTIDVVGVCIPPPPPDLDCGDISDRRFQVLPPDPHGFDGDNDGVGCE